MSADILTLPMVSCTCVCWHSHPPYGILYLCICLHSDPPHGILYLCICLHSDPPHGILHVCICWHSHPPHGILYVCIRWHWLSLRCLVHPFSRLLAFHWCFLCICLLATNIICPMPVEDHKELSGCSFLMKMLQTKAKSQGWRQTSRHTLVTAHFH